MKLLHSLFQGILLFNLVLRNNSENLIVTTNNKFTNNVVFTEKNIEKITIGNFNAFILKNPKMKKEDLEKLSFVDEVIVDKPDSVKIFYQWGLERINQCCLPLRNKNPNFLFTGKNVDIYVLDTGIKNTHQQFETNKVKKGYNPSKKNTITDDKNGHGTHVASTIIGNTLGIARDSTIIPVKVLDDNGSGTWTNVIRGIEWSVKQFKKSKRCSIISMSLGGYVNKAVNRAIDEAYKEGIFISVAAGNSYRNACNYSPASASKAYTVGSTTIKDTMSSFSNYGKCVNIFAPGSNILGAWIKSNTDTRIISGTSMACPHVTGTVALIMEEIGCSSLDTIKEKLQYLSTKGKIIKTPPQTTNTIVQVPKITKKPTTGPTKKPTTRPTKKPTTRPTKKPCLVRCRKRKNIEKCLSYKGCGCSWIDGRCRQVCEPI